MRKRGRKSIVRDLDNVFSKYIRARDGRCVVCGTTKNLQCGHLFTRVAHSTRWDEDNAWAQCSGCNMRHEYDWKPMQDAVHRKCVDIDSLYQRHKKVRKFTDSELEDMIVYYRKKLAALQP